MLNRNERETFPSHMLPHRTPAQLLAVARQGLAEAAHTNKVGIRYAAACLAALRAAAALLAARATPGPRDRHARVRSVWNLLTEVAPEFADWAAYFAGASTWYADLDAYLQGFRLASACRDGVLLHTWLHEVPADVWMAAEGARGFLVAGRDHKAAAFATHQRRGVLLRGLEPIGGAR